MLKTLYTLDVLEKPRKLPLSNLELKFLFYRNQKVI